MNAPDQFLTLNLGGAEVRVPREAAVMAFLDQVLRERATRLEFGTLAMRHAFHQDCAPTIGEVSQHGMYAGLSLHEGKPVELYLIAGEKEDISWTDAVKWAEEQGGVLPSRIDQLVLLATLKAEFKPEAYWSGEQTADDSSYAWYQLFDYGYQYYNFKDFKLRARAVRRAAI